MNFTIIYITPGGTNKNITKIINFDNENVLKQVQLSINFEDKKREQRYEDFGGLWGTGHSDEPKRKIIFQLKPVHKWIKKKRI